MRKQEKDKNMETFGNEFARKRYARYNGFVIWEHHSVYKGGAIERAYEPETPTHLKQPKALYRMQDGGIIAYPSALSPAAL